MAELDSTLRTRFAQINFAANAQRPKTDTGLADDTGLNTPPSTQPAATRLLVTGALATQPLSKRDVMSVTFSVTADASAASSNVTPLAQAPIALAPELNLSIFTTQTLATTLENLRLHVEYLLRLPLPVRVKNRLRLKYWAMSRRLEAVSELLKLDGVDKLSVDPSCFDMSCFHIGEFDLSHFDLSGEAFQGD